MNKRNLEPGSSDKEITDEVMDSTVWNEIKSESNAEFIEDYELVEDVTSLAADNIIDSID